MYDVGFLDFFLFFLTEICSRMKHLLDPPLLSCNGSYVPSMQLCLLRRFFSPIICLIYLTFQAHD
jgi:hypothetical protein